MLAAFLCNPVVSALPGRRRFILPDGLRIWATLGQVEIYLKKLAERPKKKKKKRLRFRPRKVWDIDAIARELGLDIMDSDDG